MAKTGTRKYYHFEKDLCPSKGAEGYQQICRMTTSPFEPKESMSSPQELESQDSLGFSVHNGLVLYQFDSKVVKEKAVVLC